MQTHLIQKTAGARGPPPTFYPVETMARGMRNLDQFVKKVLNCTSKYNLSINVSYSPDNIVGKYEIYPSYGDFPETFFLRSYGTWWKESEAYQREYRPQDMDPLGAEDYITLCFETPVVPRDVCIYEVYNPGAVVRIWGRFRRNDWKLLWEGLPQICPEKARKFHPTIKQYNCLINEVRLEFNQSHLKYHTSLDAVLLGGFETDHFLQFSILANALLRWEDDTGVSTAFQAAPSEDFDTCDYFSRLPWEVMVQIFDNLDLVSLGRCSRVNRTWYDVSLDPRLYQNLGFRKYWKSVDETTLNYFTQRCHILKKLDLSWCGPEKCSGNLFKDAFVIFFEKCCKYLTHLSLCHCEFLDDQIFHVLKTSRDLTELRLRSAGVSSGQFWALVELTKLVTLDLSTTKITDDTLIRILKANPNLKHINLDLCEFFDNLDDVVATASQFNKNLTSWSSFKATKLTASGARLFGTLANLRELDLAWCFMRADSEDCLIRIGGGCSQLKRLIISQWRGVNDQMLLYLVKCCKKLTQLDLLGVTVTSEVCDKALRTLPDLRLLEISFCDRITHEQVDKWRHEFPHVTIQRSCRHVFRDNMNY